MWFHKKKEEPAPPVEPPVCHHKYRDFDWYMTESFNKSTKEYTLKIYEPYVCVLCKHREDRFLQRISGTGREGYLQAIQDAYQDYPKLKRIAEVEDEIGDMQMLDPYYLDAYYKLYPERK